MQLEYHLSSMIRMLEFLSRYEHLTNSVDVIIDTAAKQSIEKKSHCVAAQNRNVVRQARLTSAWTIVFSLTTSVSSNFIELVRFRAETDDVLADHLNNVPRNALFTSKTIQNSLIEVVHQRILCDIITEVCQAKYYTIIADEVTDLSNREQLSLTLRYFLNGRVGEVSVDFICFERITGEVLAHSIPTVAYNVELTTFRHSRSML